MSARTTTLRPNPKQGEVLAKARGRHPTARPPRRTKAPPPGQWYVLVLIVIALIGLGLVMVFSASSVRALHSDGSAWSYFMRQATWAALGLVALVVTARVPYQAWRRLVTPILVVAFAAMVLVWTPLGIEVKAHGPGSSWLGSASSRARR